MSGIFPEKKVAPIKNPSWELAMKQLLAETAEKIVETFRVPLKKKEMRR